MSSGGFTKGLYQTKDGNVGKCRFQPETESLVIATVSNTAPAGPAAAGFPSAQVSSGRNTIGINCRLIRIKFDTAPTGYKQDGIITLPVFTDTAFATFQTATTGTYDVGGGAQNITIVGFTAEKIV